MKNNDRVGWFPKVRGGRLVVEVTVMEHATGDMETKTDSTTVFATSPYHISFKRSLVDYKPGVSTLVEAEITDMSGHPVHAIPAKIKVLDQAGKQIAVKFSTSTSSETGRVAFIVKTNKDHESLKITVTTENKGLNAEEQGQAEHTMIPYKSKSSEYIALARMDSGAAIKVQEIFSRTVFSNTKNPIAMSYLITSQGRILDLGSLTDDNHGKLVEFFIKPEMVPSIRIVLFAHNGQELLTDSIKLDVEPTCLPQAKIDVKLNFAANPAPGDNGTIIIRGTPNTAVGILGIDKAVYVLRDKDLLTKDKMYKEMETHDLGCGPGGGVSSQRVLENAGLVLLTNTENSAPERPAYTCADKIRRKRQIIEEIHEEHGKLAPMCCELGTRSDKLKRSCEDRAIIIIEYQGEKLEDPELCAQTFFTCCEEAQHLYSISENDTAIQKGRAGGNKGEFAGLDEEQLNDNMQLGRERFEFRETWLFQDKVIGADGEVRFGANLFHSITTWVVQAVSIVPRSLGGGMCVAEPQTIEAFKEVFMQVRMPYSVVRNEQIEIPVTIFNYSPKTQMMTVYFYGIEDLCSEAQPKKKSTEKKIRVEANSAVTTGFSMVPLKATDYSIRFVAFNGKYNDVVTKVLHVVAEGVPHEEDIAFSIDPSNTQKRKKRKIEDKKYTLIFDDEAKKQLSIVKLEPELEVVPGTESCYVTAIGDTFGATIHTSLETPDRLLRLPVGCGEQNMAYLAPTLYTLHYLKVIGKLTLAQESKAYNFVREGYKRQLTFRKPDGSYGAHIRTPSSTWLTAFVAKVFCQAEKHVFIDENVVCTALAWLAKNQQPDGSFVEHHVIYHKEMMGGVVGNVPLTAFTLLAFEKCKCSVMNHDVTRKRAIEYLKLNAPKMIDPHNLAIVTYALAVADAEAAREHNTRLLDISRYDDGLNQMYWGDGKSGRSLETTSYALQSQLIYRNIDVATSIVNWMNTQRTVGGAFWSTQDTIAAIDALSGYAIISREPDAGLVCNFTSTNDAAFRGSMNFSPENAKLLQRLELNKLGGKMHIESEGLGVSTVGITMRYNTPANPDKLCKFELSVNVSVAKEIKEVQKPAEQDELIGFFPRDLMKQLEVEKAKKKKVVKPRRGRMNEAAEEVEEVEVLAANPLIRRQKRDLEDEAAVKSAHALNFTICTKYLGNENSNMAIIDAKIVTGYRAETKDLKALVNDSNLLISRFEQSGRSVVFYLDEISNEKPTCFWFRIVREFVASNIESSLVRVYDYYEPAHSCSKFYGIDQKTAIIRKKCIEHVCICEEGGCPDPNPFASAMKYNSSAEQRKVIQEIACHEHDFFWKVLVTKVTQNEPGSRTYRFEIQSVLKEGAEKERYLNNDFRDFDERGDCELTAGIKEGDIYYLMGRDREPIEENEIKRYVYHIDKATRLQKWSKLSKGQKKEERELLKNLHHVERTVHSICQD